MAECVTSVGMAMELKRSMRIDHPKGTSGAMDVDQAAKMQHQLDAAVLESSLKLTGLGQHLQQVDGSRQEADQGVEKLQAAAATTQQEAAGQVIELTAALSTTQQEAAAQDKVTGSKDLMEILKQTM
eukprot:gene18259-24714_t